MDLEQLDEMITHAALADRFNPRSAGHRLAYHIMDEMTIEEARRVLIATQGDFKSWRHRNVAPDPKRSMRARRAHLVHKRKYQRAMKKLHRSGKGRRLRTFQARRRHQTMGTRAPRKGNMPKTSTVKSY